MCHVPGRYANWGTAKLASDTDVRAHAHLQASTHPFLIPVGLVSMGHYTLLSKYRHTHKHTHTHTHTHAHTHKVRRQRCLIHCCGSELWQCSNKCPVGQLPPPMGGQLSGLCVVARYGADERNAWCGTMRAWWAMVNLHPCTVVYNLQRSGGNRPAGQQQSDPAGGMMPL